MLRLAIVTLVLAPLMAHADDARMRRVRDLYKSGDYEGVKVELLAEYDEKPDPALLFALGQVELNLGNYEAAIDYYERFIATKPAEDQVALAQQAIGAARFRLAEPEEEPPVVESPAPLPPAPPIDKPIEHERWTLTHTGLVAFGGAAALLGAGLLYYSHHLGNDRSGTLMDYDSRLDQARTTRWTGASIAAAGTLLVGVTILW